MFSRKVTVVLDQSPFSPFLQIDEVDLFTAEEESSFEKLVPYQNSKSISSLSQILSYAGGDKVALVLVGDSGDENLLNALREDDPKGREMDAIKVAILFKKVVEIIQKNALPGAADFSVLCAASVDPENGVGIELRDSSFGLAALLRSPSSLSGPISALRSFHEANCKGSGGVFGLVRYGQLTGGVEGAEPLPFLSMPLLEPELHPSYILNSVILSPVQSSTGDRSSLKYGASELCTRNSLAEVLVQLLARTASSSSTTITSPPAAEVDAFVQSIEAPAAPSTEDWDKIFSRIFSASSKAADVQLLRLDFESVSLDRLSLFASWLVDTWFPQVGLKDVPSSLHSFLLPLLHSFLPASAQALIEANAATILSGARPVRAAKVLGNEDKKTAALDIFWEDLQPDLTVKAVGAMRISIGCDPPRVTARRLTSGGELPGEKQLLDRLEEGIFKNAFKKQFCAPLNKNVLSGETR
jgi:hypothetical protein